MTPNRKLADQLETGSANAVPAPRHDWRNIPFENLRRCEIDLMTKEESRWYSDWCWQERKKAEAPQPVVAQPVLASDPRFDQEMIAVTESGARIWLYPGEHEGDDRYSGEKMPPLTEREIRSNSYVSCMWDRSKVVGFEARPTHPTKETGETL